MQAFSALRYLVEEADSGGAPSSLRPGCEFHLYFSENLQEGPYLPRLQKPPELRTASGRRDDFFSDAVK